MFSVVVRACAVVLAIGASVASCTADRPQLTDANGGLDARCTGPHADLLLDFFPTTLAGPMAALGAPDATSVTLGPGDEITVGFIGLGGITDAAGVDLRIVAALDSGANALVKVAQSDQVFQFTGMLVQDNQELDLGVSTLTSALYARVIGTQGTIRLDAIEAVHDQCR
jgi:hypothetical protein